MTLRMSTNQFAVALAVVSAAMVAAGPALAHHPMGGATPTTFWHGFLSGIGHPIIGLDHFAFVIGVGLVSAFVAGRFIMPLLFIAATVAGCMAVVNGMTLASAEMVIAASVLVLGVIAMSGLSLPLWLLGGLFAAAGLFHGGAYAEAIVGAEATPLVAYLAAFSLTQYVIAIGAMLAVRALWHATSGRALQPRLAGAVVAGIGLTFLVEHLESLVFKAV